MEEKIILALDLPTEKEVMQLLDQLEGQIKFVKVGMELFYGTGYSIIEKIKKRGLSIFLDLKMHDIPNTVGRAAAQLTRLEVDLFNLHVAGGKRMMEEANKQVENNLAVNQKKPLVIGVTQLTSTDQKMLETEIGIIQPIENVVEHYAIMAKDAGMDGVVSSPLEVGSIKKACGSDFVTVTPGIRLEEEIHLQLTQDQKRITTPKQAFDLGTDYIVIGRSITQASNPSEVFQKMLDDLKK